MAVPVVVLQELVEEAQAVDQALILLKRTQVPAVRDSIGALVVALRAVGRIYHDAMEDGEEANHVQLRGPSGPRRPAHRDG
ncbi:MAG: hypothetical protein EHM24_33985 [Acidobacteria bacterium]|nr:MAG: hypothetical protein EHM24_33985 [Acidobacteriota bacterium]